MRMTQNLNDYQKKLIERIVDALHRGGHLTEDTLDYVDAALFPPDADRLADFLLDDEDSERDSLLDLIFYPDRSMQLALEPLLEAARFSADEARALDESLAGQSLLAPIHMPGGLRLVRIQVPDFVKSRYLDRLNITWQLDPDLAAAIERHVPPSRQSGLKIRFRNAGRRFPSDQRRFLSQMIERLPDDHPDFFGCLDLVLSLLPKSNRRLDAFGLLVEHKRTCFRSLQQVRRFEALLQRSNMETLMLQGVRAPYACADDLIQLMRLIDLVCWHVFGRTEAIDPPMEGPVRRIEDPGDTEAVFRSLLG